MKYKLIKIESNVTCQKFKLKIKNENGNNKYPQIELEKEIVGNIWDFIGKANIICFTTNNFVSTNGKNVMGAGIAKEVSTKFPDIMDKLGDSILRYGPRPFIVKTICGTHLSSFPVKPDYVVCNPKKSNIVVHARNQYKPGDTVPGFHAIADLSIIKKSAYSIRIVSDVWYSAGLLNRVILPRPGCGLGELKWEDVKSILKQDGLYDRPYLQIISKE